MDPNAQAIQDALDRGDVEGANRASQGLPASTRDPLAAFIVYGEANTERPQLLSLATQRLDDPWVGADRAAAYSGAPDRVRVSLQLYAANIGRRVNIEDLSHAEIVKLVGAIRQDSAFARIAPEFILMRGEDMLGRASAGYQRHASGHKASSATIAVTDWAPGEAPNYSVISIAGSDNKRPIVCIGTLTLEAVP